MPLDNDHNHHLHHHHVDISGLSPHHHHHHLVKFVHKKKKWKYIVTITISLEKYKKDAIKKILLNTSRNNNLKKIKKSYIFPKKKFLQIFFFAKNIANKIRELYRKKNIF